MGSFNTLAITCVAAVVLGALGVVLYRFTGVSPLEAGLVTGCLMLGAGQAIVLAGRDRTDQHIASLRRENTQLSQDLSALRRQHEGLAKLVDDIEQDSYQQTTAQSDQLAGQMRMLDMLVKQLAEGMDGSARRREPVNVAPQAHEAPADVLPEEPAANVIPFDDSAERAERNARDARVLAEIRRSLEDNRVDLYLQPIVTLPQRKTRYYEGFTRLRDTDGELIEPTDYIRLAENAGLMPAIDNLLLFRCVQVVRRMVERNRHVGVFCNISAHSLLDADFFPQFIQFMQQNTDLRDALFFEFSQEMVDASGPLEQESLSALRELGFGFSMDRVTRLDFDSDALARRGFRFVKVSSDLMLRPQDAGAQIHSADLSELLQRSGITLIVEKIEQERAVVDLLDYSVSLAQGVLFSEPRPVRSDILAGDVPPLMRSATA